MPTFNKYLIFGEFSVKMFEQVFIAFLQKAPLAFVLQYFVVQKFAGRHAEKYPTENQLVYQVIRTGFTVLIMCPVMALYSNIILAIKFHWAIGTIIGNFIPKMCVNWVFAFFVQIFALGPLNRMIFQLLFLRKSSN